MRYTTSEAIDRHIAEARRRYARNTVTHRRPLLRRLARAHGGDLFSVTAEQLDTWLDMLGVKPRTRNVYIGELGTFYRWAIRHGYTGVNPAADATKLRTTRNLPRPIPGDDLAMALAAAGARMRAWLTLMAYAGLRCCEVAGLHAEDVMRRYDPPALYLNHGTKGGHHGLVTLAATAEQALVAYGLPSSGPIFRHADGRQVSAGYVSKVTCRHLHDLGLAWTAHTLRHYFGTAVYDATRDLRATQEVMRHGDPATTALYVAWAQSETSAVVRRLGET